MNWSISSRLQPSSRKSSWISTGRAVTATELLRRGIRDHRRALAGWCVGIAAYALVLAAIFPSIKGSPAFNDLLEKYPEAFKSLFGISGGVDISRGAGFFDAELFSLMLPLLAIVLAIGSGARTLAGEEDAGRLELVFAYPVRRRDVVLAKGAAVALEVAIFCAAAYATLAVSSMAFGLGLPLGRLAGGILGVGVLALLYGCLAIAVGAASPSRALAIGIPAALAAGAYLVGGLHDLASWLDPLRFGSSFWWVGQAPLSNGVHWWHLLVVGLAGTAALAAASPLIEHRDLEAP
jgi:ABC-2 type transport system permease protein